MSLQFISYWTIGACIVSSLGALVIGIAILIVRDKDGRKP